MPGIGTLKERSLHAALKDHIAQPGDRFEVPLDGYVIDIVRGDHLIEIQTRSFSAMKRKLDTLTRDHTLHLVHPIPTLKWIAKYGPDGETRLDRRRSPQSKTVYHIFDELVSVPRIITRPNFTVEAVLVEIEEIRVNDGQGSWRRRGWSITDTRLLAVIEQHVFRTPADFLALLPDDLPRQFTTRHLADATGERMRTVQAMAYCLQKMGAVSRIGKIGNAYLYSIPSR